MNRKKKKNNTFNTFFLLLQIKKILGLLDAIEIQNLVNNSLPCQFRTISPRSYLSLDHTKKLEDKSDSDEDDDDWEDEYDHDHCQRGGCGYDDYDDYSQDDDDDVSDDISSGEKSKQTTTQKRNPFYPIKFKEVFIITELRTRC